MKKTILFVVCLAVAGMLSVSCSNANEQTVNFTLYGSNLQARLDVSQLQSYDGDPAFTFDKHTAATAKTLEDCQSIRKEMNLSDWAYVKMLDKLSVAALDSTNDAVVLMATLLNLSGYGVQLMLTEDSTRQMRLAYRTEATVLNNNFWVVDNENYALYGDSIKGATPIKMLSNGKGKPVDFHYQGEMKLAQQLSEPRTLTSKKNQDFSFTVQVNKNLLDYYGELPTVMYDNNFMTRWTNMAEFPLEQQLQDSLITQMKQQLQGKSQQEQVQQLLWWVQTAFDYEYDEDVWGYDRAFYCEETLFYPYCDTEDRSILFSRLVRDVTGLDVVFIYYPGHTAVGVCFTDADVKGASVDHEGRRYVVCDPTYILSTIGIEMPPVVGKEKTIMPLGK